MRPRRAGSLAIVLLAALLVTTGAGGPLAADKTMMNTAAYVLDHPNLSRKVSLALNDTNIVDALVYLSEKAEINVAVSKDVAGRATLSLNNVSIRDALDIILLANELACEKRGEIFYVMPAEAYESLHGERWAEPRQVKIFKMSYAKPADVAVVLNTIKSNVGSIVVDNDSGTVVVMDTREKLNQMTQTVETMDHALVTKVFDLQYANAVDVVANLAPRINDKGMGTVRADEKYNRVVVNTLPGKLDEVEKVVRELDRQIKQVLIEAKIVRVTLTPTSEFGVDWQQLMRRQPFSVDSHFPVSSDIGSSFGQVTIGQIGGMEISSVLKMLQTVGETKLISSPRISALNNEEAKIFVGVREFYTTSTTTLSNGESSTAVTVNFIDVGVSLKVTPVINSDGFILMRISPEVSRVERREEIATGDEIPVIDTTSAATRVMVKDGNTIIIGGLIKNEMDRTTDKFPLLGDIPIIGNAFKHVSEEKVKSEMVVFLTPHIIAGDEDMTEFDKKKLKPLKGYDENA